MKAECWKITDNRQWHFSSAETAQLAFFLSCTTAFGIQLQLLPRFQTQLISPNWRGVCGVMNLCYCGSRSVWWGFSQQGVSQKCALCDNPIFTARKNNRGFAMNLWFVWLLDLWAHGSVGVLGPWIGGRPWSPGFLCLLWAWECSQGSFLVIPICLLGRSDQWLCKTCREWLWLRVQLCPGQWAGVWSLQVSAPGKTGTLSVSGLISLVLFFDFLVSNPAQTVTYLCVDSKRQKAAEFSSCPLKLQVPKAVLDFSSRWVCVTLLSVCTSSLLMHALQFLRNKTGKNLNSNFQFSTAGKAELLPPTK